MPLLRQKEGFGHERHGEVRMSALAQHAAHSAGNWTSPKFVGATSPSLGWGRLYLCTVYV